MKINLIEIAGVTFMVPKDDDRQNSWNLNASSQKIVFYQHSIKRSINS